jgi:hypothetical protein
MNESCSPSGRQTYRGLEGRVRGFALSKVLSGRTSQGGKLKDVGVVESASVPDVLHGRVRNSVESDALSCWEGIQCMI